MTRLRGYGYTWLRIIPIIAATRARRRSYKRLRVTKCNRNRLIPFQIGNALHDTVSFFRLQKSSALTKHLLGCYITASEAVLMARSHNPFPAMLMADRERNDPRRGRCFCSLLHSEKVQPNE